MIISRDSIKELYKKIKETNNKIIYNAKISTFGYADIEEIYYKGQSIFMGNQKEILKFQEYRLNLEKDLTFNKENKNLPITKEELEYIEELEKRVKQIKTTSRNELIGITDDGELLINVDLYKVLDNIYNDITKEKEFEM